MTLSLRHTGLPILVLICCLNACSEDDATAPPPPQEKPLAVSDLEAVSATDRSVTLSFTVPGLVPAKGSVARYDIRFVPLDHADLEWADWAHAAGLPDPGPSGSVQQVEVTGLTAGTVYMFRLAALSDTGLWSGPSNPVIATADPILDTTAPDPVSSLLLWDSDAEAVTVAWRPAADDLDLGTASAYEVRFAETALDDQTWPAAAVAAGPITADPVSGRLTTTIAGLDAGTVYQVAVKAADEIPNWSAISDVLSCSPGGNRTWYVTADGTGTVPTIQAAVDAAVPGDLILVAPGRYTWTNQQVPPELNQYGLVFFARDVTGFDLVSEDGPAATILDAEGRGGVMFLQAYNDVTIEGFTLTGGDRQQRPDDHALDIGGGGLTFHLTSPTIRDCVITGNRAPSGGGVWYGGVGEPRLENCAIFANEAEWGGGVCLINSYDTVTISGCEIYANRAAVAGGGLFAYHVAFRLEDSVLRDNASDDRGGGLAAMEIHPSEVAGCTIADNLAFTGGGVRLADLPELDLANSLLLTNSIVARNLNGGAFSSTEGVVLEVRNCCSHGNAGGDQWPDGAVDGGGNFLLDPLFCGPVGSGGLGLQAGSPCAPGNHPQGLDVGLIGALPVNCSR